MTNKNKKAFTLVELLAVIVILAIILVIAVPQIMNVIAESRKGALISSAKLIASTAETKKVSNDTLGINKAITCEDVAQINDEDYASCVVSFDDNGKAKVIIIGKGKFEGMAVCGGTKEDAETKNSDECQLSAVEKIESLATKSNIEGLELTSDGNIRYTGTSPKNYINFNGENWRIIGTFTVTTASGKAEKLMKIVRNEQFTQTMSWDSSASDVNNGYGINEWSQADLMTMLNTYYIGTSTICSYCSGAAQETCSNDCSSSVAPIGNTYASMIEEVVWNTGAFSSSKISVETAYNEERGTTGNICTSGTYCNDSVTRTTEWTGKVGLIYPSDYGYASTDTSCRANIKDGINYPCKNTNWLHSGSIYWTISPLIAPAGASNVWRVLSGYAGGIFAYFGYGVRPAIYLKSDVSITSGDGSSTSPYQISMS